MYVADPHKSVVVLYHGNAGSACDRSFYADLFSAAGYGYIVVEYAGYSNDPRQTTHDLVKQDVANVVTYLQEQQIESVTVVGTSIGSGAAAYHTALQPPEKLLLLSPFTDLHAVAQNRFWFYPTALLVDNAFDNVQNLRDYTGPVTIIHGGEDRIIPQRLGQTLFDHLSTEKAFVTIPKAGHNDLFHYPKTYEALRAFLTN
jgi:pimeloyl-ACP methyl ester carboxylesterase